MGGSVKFTGKRILIVNADAEAARAMAGMVCGFGCELSCHRRPCDTPSSRQPQKGK